MAVLDLADEVMLLQSIRPELPIKGISSQMILDKMKNDNKKVMSKEELLKRIQKSKPALLITAGAGDIDREVQALKQILETN
jgi:UDP-N-acetylmuramate--alanine ligase